MNDTPRTDEVLKIQHNWGEYPGGEDGVTPQEAYDSMVSSLKQLCKKLEIENQVMAQTLAEIEVSKASMAFLDEAFNSGDGTYRP